MSTKRIRTLIKKEWAEVFKNRWVIFSVIFLPLLFTAIPLIMLAITGRSGVSDLSTDLPAQFTQMCPYGTPSGVCFQVYLISQFMVLFLMTPVIIPINIAAYSIVGEKTTRSLEPLLATPITTAELLTGKNLAAVIPAVLATWGGFFLYLIGGFIIAGAAPMIATLSNAVWWIAIFVIGPLMAVLSVNFSLMVSSRVTDPRSAEQLSTVIILPVLLLFLGQVSGFFIFSPTIAFWFAIGSLLLDVVMIYVAIQMFQRETILTRWK
jgi:ABC-2 type transport system permease protein